MDSSRQPPSSTMPRTTKYYQKLVRCFVNTLNSAIKSRVVQMAIDGGYGRNQIARELNNQGIKISTTTVTHLIQDWKHQHQHQPQQEQATTTNESPLRLSQHSSPQSPQTLSPQSQVYSESLQSMSGDNSSISTSVNMNNTDGIKLLINDTFLLPL
jgi:transposase-like protein